MKAHPIDYRYGSPEMRETFSQKTRLEKMLKVEAALVKALANLGKAPQSAAKEVAEKAGQVKLKRVKEIEEQTKHDVMAMVKALAELCSSQTARYVHLTATSYDIVDTALALQIRQGIEILVQKADKLQETLIQLAEKHENTVMVGRTHGQHATPITFGFKLANYIDKLGNDINNLACDHASIRGKFSGATGTYAAQQLFGVEGLEDQVMEILGLAPADISTQVVAREDWAMLIADLAITAGTLEQMAKEVRNLQRTEIREVAEGFGKEQVGSSAMPQKKNPINSENICGNARIIRSCVLPALENIALEHERDLTNSSCERSLLPTAFILLDDMLSRADKVFSGLQVYPEKMKENLEMTKGRIMAEAVVTELAKKGMERQKAHEELRKASMKSLKEEKHLKKVLLKNKKIMKYLKKKDLEELMKYENYTGRAQEKTRFITKKWKGVKAWE